MNQSRLILPPDRVSALRESINAPFFTFHVECFDKDGNLKWVDDFRNTVMNAGKLDLLDKYFGGSTYTAAWYFGLIDLASYTAIAATDTMASHGGWIENQDYSQANRPAISFGAASGTSPATKSTNANSVFSINANSKTIKGAFVTTVNTKGGTTGILYSAGLFSTGDKAVNNGDTLNVTGSWTAS